GDELRIEQGRLAVVTQGLPVEVDDGAAGFFENALGGGGIPFRRRAETHVEVGASRRDAQELERRSQRHQLMGTERAEHPGQTGIAMRTTAGDDEIGATLARAARSDLMVAVADPGAAALPGPGDFPADRSLDHAEHGPTGVDQ